MCTEGEAPCLARPDDGGLCTAPIMLNFDLCGGPSFETAQYNYDTAAKLAVRFERLRSQGDTLAAATTLAELGPAAVRSRHAGPVSDDDARASCAVRRSRGAIVDEVRRRSEPPPNSLRVNRIGSFSESDSLRRQRFEPAGLPAGRGTRLAGRARTSAPGTRGR